MGKGGGGALAFSVMGCLVEGEVAWGVSFLLICELWCFVIMASA